MAVKALLYLGKKKSKKQRAYKICREKAIEKF